MTLASEISRQYALEQVCYNKGMDRYNANKERTGLGGRSSSSVVFDDLVLGLADAILEAQNTLKAQTMGKPASWHPWFISLDTRKAAWLTVYELLGSQKEDVKQVKDYGLTTSSLSKRIG